MTNYARFHLAIAVVDLPKTESFYVSVLGCSIGRRAERWIDFDFYGHQISAHLVDRPAAVQGSNLVDGDGVPIPHFGLILPPADWQALKSRLEAHDTSFLIGPKTRFEGQPGEQSTMFLSDPSGNHLEFKSFASDSMVFASDEGALAQYR